MAEKYTKETWQFWLFIVCAWVSFPFLAAWLMLTHPGKVALIWKKELCGTWFHDQEKSTD